MYLNIWLCLVQVVKVPGDIPENIPGAIQLITFYYFKRNADAVRCWCTNLPTMGLLEFVNVRRFNI
jgi:hypothetical protein